MGHWKIECNAYKSVELDKLLAEGYEPFAVTEDDDHYPTIWLRCHVANDIPSIAAIRELPSLVEIRI